MHLSRRNLLRAGLVGAFGLAATSCGIETDPQSSQSHSPYTTRRTTSSTQETTSRTTRTTHPSSQRPTTASPESTTSSSTHASHTMTHSTDETTSHTATHTTPPTTASTTEATTSKYNYAPAKIRKYLPSDRFIQHGPTERSRVAITFDDFFGSSGADYLEGLLDIAQQKKLRFTLFPTGYALDTHRKLGRSDVWKQAVRDGHVIGNHTYDHLPLSAMSTPKILDQLRRQEDALDKVLGADAYRQFLMRPPGGNGGFPSHVEQFAHTRSAIADAGYYMTMWTTDSNNPNTGQVVTGDKYFINKIFTYPPEKVRNGSIILIHPTTLTLSGVNKLLQGLSDKQYTPTTVPDMFMPKLSRT